MRVRVVVLVVPASACTAVVSLAGGPARFVAGLVLALVIPGWLAVLALVPADPERRLLRLTLVVPLGLGVCAVAGTAVALLWPGFNPARSALALLVACVLLAIRPLALLRGSSGQNRGLGHYFGEAVISRGLVLCALPALALTGFAVWRVADFTREPGPAYTEFATDSANSLEVRSHERATRRFRLETSVDGQVSETAEFDLRPGETARFVVAGGGVVRARLYVAGQDAPYRELSF
jgi:hypothetical protein